MRSAFPFLVLSSLVAACTAAPPVPVSGAASPTPAAATAGLRDQLQVVAGVASANAIANQAEKASIISGNGSAIISHNGGGIISHNGGGIISTNGGGLVGNSGGTFRLLADAAIAADPAANERMTRRFDYLDGVSFRTYRDPATGASRQVLVAPDGKAVSQSTLKALSTWPKGDLKQGQIDMTRHSLDGARAFTASYTIDQAEDGSPLASHLGQGHVTAAGGLDVAIERQEFDLAQGTGQVRVAYRHLGLVEEATLKNVRLDQAEEDVFGSTDALGLYEGEGKVSKADGTLLYHKTQTRRGTRLVRELTFPDGLTLQLTWNRDTRSFVGPVSRNGQALGTATLRLGADGSVGIEVKPADPAQPALALGYDVDGKLLEALPPPAAPAAGTGEHWRVDTIAGINQRGFADGRTDAEAPVLFNGPTAIARGGKYYYLADSHNGRIRRFTLEERPDGLPVCTFETLAGNGGTGFADGAPTVARFQRPYGLVATKDDVVYVTDGNRIRQIAPDGTVSTLAGGDFGGHDDGRGVEASFSLPDGLALLPDGSLVVVDTGNYKLRRVTPDGVVTTLAGDGTSGHANGPAAQARFGFPEYVAVAPNGDIYVTDLLDGSLRRVTAAGMVEEVLARDQRYALIDGTGTDRAVLFPAAPALGPGGELYFADGGVVRRLDPDGRLRTLAGSAAGSSLDGPMEDAGFHSIAGIWVDPKGDRLLVADQGASELRLVWRNR